MTFSSKPAVPDAPGGCWECSPLLRTGKGGVQRVSASVEGREIWFEAEGAELLPLPEVLATLLLIPALHFGARVRIDAALDEAWLTNTTRLLPILARWWDYPQVHPIDCAGRAAPSGPRSARTGLCFTGGADSFHSLLRGPSQPDCLVYVHGFDVSLRDRRRSDAIEGSLREVARVCGKELLLVRSNLRQHPIYAAINWERTHGAALVAVGQLLCAAIGRIVVPSSWSYQDDIPWGSTWETDPLWSTSRLDVVHDDATWRRRDKVPQIAAEPLVQQHLRVCWENRAPVGNCSRCEKCLRTMVMLAACGQLGSYRVFDTATPLARLVDGISSLSEHIRPCWRYFLDCDLEPPVKAAIARLLARSERGPRPRVWARLRDRARGWAGTG